jgi:hypothetical protein
MLIINLKRKAKKTKPNLPKIHSFGLKKNNLIEII